MTERINMTIPKNLRDRFEAWRATQYRATGRIPSLADAARILIHKGLLADSPIDVDVIEQAIRDRMEDTNDPRQWAEYVRDCLAQKS